MHLSNYRDLNDLELPQLRVLPTPADSEIMHGLWVGAAETAPLRFSCGTQRKKCND